MGKKLAVTNHHGHGANGDTGRKMSLHDLTAGVRRRVHSRASSDTKVKSTLVGSGVALALGKKSAVGWVLAGGSLASLGVTMAVALPLWMAWRQRSSSAQ
ncbi:MAG: hypothetical protein H7831_15365 [Magnetococcus sp. WYHC-3]